VFEPENCDFRRQRYLLRLRRQFNYNILIQGRDAHAATHPRTLIDHIARYHREPRRARPYITPFQSMDFTVLKGVLKSSLSLVTVESFISRLSSELNSTVYLMQRIKQVSAHLAGGPPGLFALERKNPDDVVITLAIRSPVCKAKKGGFKDAR
jgi:hypothetical protein